METKSEKEGYQFGDKNTKFFHACASQRKKKNWIKSIKDTQGRLLTEHWEIERVFQQFYCEPIYSSNPSLAAVEGCLQCVEERGTPSMNEELQQPFTKEEIKAVVQQTTPLKSLGPNGFSACLYQSY